MRDVERDDGRAPGVEVLPLDLCGVPVDEAAREGVSRRDGMIVGDTFLAKFEGLNVISKPLCWWDESLRIYSRGLVD